MRGPGVCRWGATVILFVVLTYTRWTRPLIASPHASGGPTASASMIEQRAAARHASTASSLTQAPRYSATAPTTIAVRGGAAVGPIDEVRRGVSDPVLAVAATTLDRRPWP